MFTGLFKQQTFDPRWLTYGVFEFAPTASRDSWLYVTSGMSNAWEAETPDSTSVSGLGCEFVFETTRQGQWPIIRLLHLTVFQILLCHGRYPRRERLNDFDRIPLRGSIRPEPSILSYLFLAPPSGIPREAQLESGRFDFSQVVGISDAEAEFAGTHGGDALLQLLRFHNCFPVTDPDRGELNTHAA
jgi:hypothetical protein